jgi:hypothetical protein
LVWEVEGIEFGVIFGRYSDPEVWLLVEFDCREDSGVAAAIEKWAGVEVAGDFTESLADSEVAFSEFGAGLRRFAG